MGTDASDMRSVACTGGVHAGTDTGVGATNVVEDAFEPEGLVVDVDEELFELHAATSSSADEARTSAVRRARRDLRTSNTVNQLNSVEISASSSCFRTLPVALYGSASRKITYVGTL